LSSRFSRGADDDDDDDDDDDGDDGRGRGATGAIANRTRGLLLLLLPSLRPVSMLMVGLLGVAIFSLLS